MELHTYIDFFQWYPVVSLQRHSRQEAKPLKKDIVPLCLKEVECSQSYSISQYYYQIYIIMKFTAAIAIAAVSGANAYSFSGTSLKATTNNGANMQMSTGMGVNGFGRIGRLVTRIMMEDDDIKLSAINAGSATTDYSKFYSVRFVHIINVLYVGAHIFLYVYIKRTI